jgi:hypothetical protein
MTGCSPVQRERTRWNNLRLQHVDALEQETKEEESVQQAVADRLARARKVALPMAA